MTIAEEHWLIIKATPVFDEQKNVKFAIIITNDITELKQTQLELEKAHRELEDRINVRTAELSQAVQEPAGRDPTRKKQNRSQQNAADAEALSHIAARLNAQLGLDAVLNTVCEEAARVAESMPAALVSCLFI